MLIAVGSIIVSNIWNMEDLSGLLHGKRVHVVGLGDQFKKNFFCIFCGQKRWEFWNCNVNSLSDN